MVRHILKDGRQVESIEGIVIRKEEFESIYNLMTAINEREVKNGNNRQ